MEVEEICNEEHIITKRLVKDVFGLEKQ